MPKSWPLGDKEGKTYLPPKQIAKKKLLSCLLKLGFSTLESIIEVDPWINIALGKLGKKW